MSNFVKKRHASFEAPEGVIFDLVKKATKFNPIRRERIIEGYDSEVYDVLTEGQNFIVRINRFGGVGYKEEAWALEQCRKHRVPVPTTILIDTVILDGKKYDVTVQSKVKGMNFRKAMDNLSKENIEKVLAQAGEVLRKIHNIKTDGFYRLNPDRKWDFSTWNEVMTSSLKGRVKEEGVILSAGFSKEDFEFMIRMHKLYTEKYPCEQPVLCHGDYTPEHWFIDDNLNITGIIDFGDMKGGPPILDLAMLSNYEPEIDMKPLLRGYGQILNKEFEMQLNLQKLVLLMGYLAHFIKQDNREEVDSNRALLRNTLEKLRSGVL